MAGPDAAPDDHAAAPGTHPDLDRLKHAIQHGTHLLPSQGPITVFILHNTLHAFEDQPFDQAVAKAARVFGCQPYLTEERFRAELARGRIRFTDLREVLADDLGTGAAAGVAGLTTRFQLRLTMRERAIPVAPTRELLWYVAETDALRKVRADAPAATRARLIADPLAGLRAELRERGSGPGPARPSGRRRTRSTSAPGRSRSAARRGDGSPDK